MSADSTKPVMDWVSENKVEAMALFKQKVEIFFKLKKVKAEDKVGTLLLLAGDEGLKLYNSWNLPDDEADNIVEVWKRFGEYGNINQNFRVARLYLRNMNQITKGTDHDKSETVDEYMARIRTQALKCNFRDDLELEERLIEQLIAGSPYQEVQKDLLAADNTLKLEKAIQIARNHEASLIHMEMLAETRRPTDESKSITAIEKLHKCSKCGLKHPFKPKRKCPAHGSVCNFCKKTGHWEKVCRRKKAEGDVEEKGARKSKGRKHGKKNIDCMDQSENDSDSEFDELEFSMVQIDSIDTRDEIFSKVQVILPKANRRVKASLSAKVDTGAQGNILPYRIFKKMFPKPSRDLVKPSKAILTAYNGSKIPQCGIIELECQHGDSKWCTEKFYIADTTGPAILGLPSCRTLRMLTFHCAIQDMQPINSTEDLIKAYPDQFDGIGHFKGKYHIVLDPEAAPVIHAPRKCPIHMKDEVKAELEKMTKDKIIRKVVEPTDWVNSLAYSRKANGQLRICLDPKDLNKAIKRCHHRTPTLEETTYMLTGASCFSKLDAKNGYWSVELDKESQLLTTFNSPFGRFCFERMPFGLVMSQDVFQQKMDQILEQCSGAIGIADDVIVFGKNEQDHDRNLHNLMRVAKEHGLMFNSSKCQVKTKNISFFGAIYDAQGVHPDPKKVQDIKNIETPSNQRELQEFLGMVTYMSPFIPRLSEHTAPLRGLLKKESEFVWSQSHEEAFTKIKQLITTDTTLAYFDPNKDTVIQVDASGRGLGAALLQGGRPVAFASKSLTSTEQRYANIEREMLAVVFGCKRFHTYVYGRPFTIESDHKPLQMIVEKNLTAAPPRLQRMLLEIQGYDLSIKYKPGKDVPLADGLSRLKNTNSDESPIKLDIKFHLIQFSEKKTEQLKDESRKDPEIAALKEVIINGWPERQKDLPQVLRPYWSFRDELSIEDSLVLKGPRVFIPVSMRAEILKQIHTAHMGVEKSRLRARSCVYWYNIDRDIEETTKNCEICQQYQRAQQKESLLQYEIPTTPWHTISSDLFYLDGENYIVTACHYSKFPFVKKLGKYTTSESVVKYLQQLFGEQGIPCKLITDNGPQYASSTFKEFAHSWGFTHVTTSPHYPQANGFIEKYVQTVKNILTKSKESGSNANMALLCWRTTPIAAQMPSPAELLYGRKMRGNLPLKIVPNELDRDRIYQKLQERQESQKHYYDRNAKDLPPLSIKQPILIQDPHNGKWERGTVEETCKEPRSYKVETPNGNILRRNRRHLRETTETGSARETEGSARETETTATSERPKRNICKPKRLVEEI